MIVEGVTDVMGGHILEHESKTIYNDGANEDIDLGPILTKETIALRMYRNDYTIEQIASLVDVSINLVKQWIQHSERDHTA